MVVLGIDSSDRFISVGLTDASTVLISQSSDPEDRNKNLLHQFIVDTLKAARVTLDDIDGVSIAIGPGSFTGLRVGLAVAKGICWARHLSLAGVSSLMAVAACARKTTEKILAVKL